MHFSSQLLNLCNTIFGNQNNNITRSRSGFLSLETTAKYSRALLCVQSQALQDTLHFPLPFPGVCVSVHFSPSSSFLLTVSPFLCVSPASFSFLECMSLNSHRPSNSGRRCFKNTIFALVQQAFVQGELSFSSE